ncbi:MAG: hypothetical protein VXX85_02040 [Candidatus Margulisiibacteriota bacterium]|nr:hypothetical protein [Candidatus Margulisiibacteriota bacterium]
MVNKITQVLVFLLIQLVIGCLASSNETSHFDGGKMASFVVADWHYVAVDFNQNQLFYNDFLSYKIKAF